MCLKHYIIIFFLSGNINMNFNFYLKNIVVNIFILIKSLISKLTGVRGELLYDLIHGSCNLKGFEVHY